MNPASPSPRTDRRLTSQLLRNGTVLTHGVLLIHHHLFSSALVTADVDAVRDRLPSDRLHPLRASRQRALLAVYIADQTWQIGAANGRFGALGIAAMVTRGDRPLPPLAPVAASERAAAKSGYGWCYLEFAATSTTARDILTGALGLQGFVADLHIDITARHGRGSCSVDNELVLALTTTPRDNPTPHTDHALLYGWRNKTVVGTPVIDQGPVRNRWGRRAATLEVGDHPVGRRLSDLDLAETGLFSDLWIDGEEWYTPPIHTHPMTRDPRPYLGRDSAQGTFAITRRGNVEKVDQAPTLPTRSPAPPVKASALS